MSGKDQITADALSQAPISMPADSDIQQTEEVAAFAKQAVEILPASTAKLTEIINLQKEDNITVQVRKYCTEGWLGYMPPKNLLKQYYTNREHFTIVNNMPSGSIARNAQPSP